jgi:hypothetical protein
MLHIQLAHTTDSRAIHCYCPESWFRPRLYYSLTQCHTNTNSRCRCHATKLFVYFLIALLSNPLYLLLRCLPLTASFSVINICYAFQRQGICSLTSVSRPALRTTQPPIQWVPGVKRGRAVTLTTHPNLQPRSRISRS